MADKNFANPLEELYTDSSQTNSGDLLQILKPFIRLNREDGKIIFTPEGIKLASNKKIILLFLAKKALFLLGDISVESLAPKEVKSEFGKNIPSGTIDGNLRRFLKNGLLRSQHGKYFIPDFNIFQIKDLFK